METPLLRIGTRHLQMETPLLRVRMCLLRMETPLRGRSGGHTGAAPTISRMVRVIRLSEEPMPVGKNKEDCVVEGFDGGW